VAGMGAACTNCMDSARPACNTQASNADSCKKDADCVKYVACLGPCLGK
jgi:hypothetical protein